MKDYTVWENEYNIEIANVIGLKMKCYYISKAFFGTLKKFIRQCERKSA